MYDENKTHSHAPFRLWPFGFSLFFYPASGALGRLKFHRILSHYPYTRVENDSGALAQVLTGGYSWGDLQGTGQSLNTASNKFPIDSLRQNTES